MNFKAVREWALAPISYSQLYSIGGFCCVMSVFLVSTPYVFGYMLTTGFLLIACGFIWHIVKAALVLAERSSKPKNIILALASVLLVSGPYFFASIIAKHKIAELTQLDAVFFPHSLIILTAVFYVYALVLFLSLALSVVVVLGLIITCAESITAVVIKPIIDMINALQSKPLDNGHKQVVVGIKRQGMLIAATFTLAACFMVGGAIEAHRDMVNQGARVIIALADHYANSICSNHPSRSRIAPLKNNWVSVATPVEHTALGVSFQTLKCKSKLDQ